MADKADNLPCRLRAQATGTRHCGALAGYRVEPFGYAAFVLFGLPSRDEVRALAKKNPAVTGVMRQRELKADLDGGATLTELAGRIYAGDFLISDTTPLGAPGKVKTHTAFAYATQRGAFAAVEPIQRGTSQGAVIQALLLCGPAGRVSFADTMVWAAAKRV